MSERKVFHDSIIPIPVESGPAPQGLLVEAAQAEHGDERMTLHFSLALPQQAQDDLESAVARGETVPAADLSTKFGAKADDADSLADWLAANGFRIESRSSDNTSIYASAPVSDIATKLDVQMVRVNKAGLTYTAARNAPSLPAGVGDAVQAIGGLQPYHRAHKNSIRQPAPKALLAAAGAGAAADPLLAGKVANAAPYFPDEIRKAYDADDLGTGAGQTIAILIDTFPSDADLTAFWTTCGLPVTTAQIQKINVSGGAVPPTEGEETLDVQWTSGIATGATIRVYATGSLNFVALDQALDRIIDDIPTQPGMRQLSISLGLGETYFGGSGGEVATQHQKFLKLAAAGVNIFVSTGDAGSNPDSTGHSATGPTQAEYESTDPCVIAVGGTTLKLTATGTVASEVGWSSGGGGKSMYFPRPAWQQGHRISGTQRLVPDVSATADPEEGALIVFNGKGLQIGGTSWSAPVWAGFCALINADRIAAGKAALPFLNPLLYPLPSGSFRDIKTGNNGMYHAAKGFDLVTGLGVPQVGKLAGALG